MLILKPEEPLEGKETGNEDQDKLEPSLSLIASSFDDAGDLWSKLMLFIISMHLHLTQDLEKLRWKSGRSERS